MYKTIFSCKNKVAVVAGGCGLLGREVVKALSEFGALVYIADINSKNAVNLLREKKIKYIYFDISSEDSIEKAMNEIIRKAGRIDILVNSAYPKTEDWGLKFEKVSFDSWKKNINDHLGGYFLSSRTAAEIMKEQGGGAIINLASIYGVTAPDFNIYEGTKMTMPVAYAAIKSGIIGLTRYIATYYGRHNVRANVVSPGGVFDNQNINFVRRYSQKTPLGRMAAPRDIVGAVIYLASEASSYITGCNLIVDGGWTVW